MTPERGMNGRILAFVAMVAGLGSCFAMGEFLPKMAELAPAAGPLPPLDSWNLPLCFGVAPLLSLGLALAWWLPGALWAAVLFRPRHLATWILHGFVVAFLLNSATLAAAKAAGGFELDARAHLLAIGLSHLVAFIAFAMSQRAPLGELSGRGLAGFAVALPLALTALLVPGIFWTNLSDDGQEALFMGESLQRAFLPSWPTKSGQVGLGVGMFASAWMNEWFTGLLGRFDAVPRLPFITLVPVVLAGVWECVRVAQGRLRGEAAFALTLGVGLVAYVLATSAGYNPYFCEIASPAAFEFLLLAALLATLASILDGRWLMALPSVAIAVLARPTPLLILALGFGVALLIKGGARKRWLVGCALGIVVCVGLAFAHQRFYLPLVGEGSSGYGSASVLSRFRFLRLFPYERFLFALVPCGVLPWLAVIFWKKLDAEARRLWLVSLLYLLTFVFPAFVSLHHFAPAMVLPLIVLGRLMGRSEGGARWGFAPSRSSGSAGAPGCRSRRFTAARTAIAPSGNGRASSCRRNAASTTRGPLPMPWRRSPARSAPKSIRSSSSSGRPGASSPTAGAENPARTPSGASSPRRAETPGRSGSADTRSGAWPSGRARTVRPSARPCSARRPRSTRRRSTASRGSSSTSISVSRPRPSTST